MTTLVDHVDKRYVRPCLKVKKLVPEAVIPSKAKENDTGYDVTAISDPEFNDTYVQYRTGLSIEVPEGYHTELFPRSSISKYDLVLANSVGMIDNGYRGELLFRFKLIKPSVGPPSKFYKKGDKIGQIVIRKTESLPIVEVDELSSTERGDGGFGSSGK